MFWNTWEPRQGVLYFPWHRATGKKLNSILYWAISSVCMDRASHRWVLRSSFYRRVHWHLEVKVAPKACSELYQCLDLTPGHLCHRRTHAPISRHTTEHGADNNTKRLPSFQSHHSKGSPNSWSNHWNLVFGRVGKYGRRVKLKVAINLSLALLASRAEKLPFCCPSASFEKQGFQANVDFPSTLGVH